MKELKKTKAIEAVSAPATSAIECKEKVLDQGNAGNLVSKKAHDISPSDHSSVPKSVLLIDDLSQDLLSTPASNVSSSYLSKTPSHTPTAALPTPSSDQAVTLSSAQFNYLVASISDLKSNQSVMHQNISSFLAGHGKVNVPVLDQGSRPPVVDGCEPQSAGALCEQDSGGTGTGGEPPMVGSCPRALDPALDRSRKRVRESKDSKSKIKRSRASSRRPSGSSVDLSVSVSGLRPIHSSLQEVGSENVVKVNIGMLGSDRSESRYARSVRDDSVFNPSVDHEEAFVPQASLDQTPAAFGKFNESMELALARICKDYAASGPIVQQGYQIIMYT